MARAAEEQAAILAASLADRDTTFEPSLRARIVAQLVTVLGPRPPVLAAMKVRGVLAA
jgi:uncharacterized Rossmann fold enzyme